MDDSDEITRLWKVNCDPWTWDICCYVFWLLWENQISVIWLCLCSASDSPMALSSESAAPIQDLYQELELEIWEFHRKVRDQKWFVQRLDDEGSPDGLRW